MKVLLIETWGYPLGLTYLAAVLEKKNIDVKIFDMCLKKNDRSQLIAEIKDYSPDLVGITSVTPTFPQALGIARVTKEALSQAMVVLGGIHVTVRPEDALSHREVDFVIRGEGEYTILELVEALGGERSYREIKGLSYKRKGKIIHNPSRPLNQDLDSLPFPARHLLNPDDYTLFFWKERFTSLGTSIGCKGACTFCIHSKRLLGPGFRANSPDYVVREIEEVHNQLGIRYFRIIDDNFTFDRNRVLKICDLLKEKSLDIFWDMPNGTRTDTIDKELMQRMYRAGCFNVDFGIESGDKTVLKKMGKGVSLNTMRQAVRDAKACGLIVGGYFMFGNLGDNRERMNKTIQFAKELNCHHVSFSLCTPYPGTVLWDRVEKEGRWLNRDNWAEATIFGKPTFELGEVTEELLSGYRKYALRKYYLRFGYLFSLFKRLFSFWKGRQWLIELDRFFRSFRFLKDYFLLKQEKC